VAEGLSLNIDFQADPGFSAYVVLLMVSGIAMLVLASPTVKRSTTGLRALNALFGLGFLGYGFYLAFIFHGGGYLIFFKAFILPVVLILRTIQSARASHSRQLPARPGGSAFNQQASPSSSPTESAPPAGNRGASRSPVSEPTQP
jgi:hypothetical protein